MPITGESVVFKHGAISNYKNSIIDPNAIYFTDDTGEIFVGDKAYSSKTFPNSYIPAIQTDAFESINLANKQSMSYIGLNANDEFISGELCHTNYIDVIPGEKINISSANNITAYDNELKVIPSAGIENEHSGQLSYTVPNGVSYIRVTLHSSNLDTLMINRGTALASYVPYNATLKNSAIPYFEDRVKTSPAVRKTLTDNNHLVSINNDANSVLLSKTIMNNGTVIFNSHTSFMDRVYTVGSYYEAGQTVAPIWINIKTFPAGKVTVYSRGSVVGELTSFTKSASVSVYVNIVDAKLKNILIYTNGVNYSIIPSTEVIFDSIGVASTSSGGDCNISVINHDINKPVWLLGDSKYFNYNISAVNVNNTMASSNIKNNSLIIGANETNSENVLVNFNSLLSIASPKYAVFAAGNFDTYSDYVAVCEDFVHLCYRYEIIPIICALPTTTNGVNMEQKKRVADLLNVRKADIYSAVGCTSSGVWSDVSSWDNSLSQKIFTHGLIETVPEIVG